MSSQFFTSLKQKIKSPLISSLMLLTWNILYEKVKCCSTLLKLFKMIFSRFFKLITQINFCRKNNSYQFKCHEFFYKPLCMRKREFQTFSYYFLLYFQTCISSKLCNKSIISIRKLLRQNMCITSVITQDTLWFIHEGSIKIYGS